MDGSSHLPSHIPSAGSAADDWFQDPAQQRVADEELRARIQQRIIDAEIFATRRALLSRLRRQLRDSPRALFDPEFLAVADFATVLDAIMLAVILAGADAGHLQLRDPQTGALHLSRQNGLTARLVSYFTVIAPGQPTACAASAATGLPVIIDDISRHPVFAGQPTLDVMREAGLRAVHSYPLDYDGGPLLGVLSFHYRTTSRRRGHGELVAWCAARALTRAAQP